MTVIVATNSSILKKRLMRFFSAENIKRRELLLFLEEVSQHGDVLLFGGAIRDIALNGIRHFNSDLDFVFAGDAKILQGLLANKAAKANKFGGYRVQNQHLDIDIWPISETWAFKQSVVNYQSIASLLNTTITNWDAILFSWQSKKLIYAENYFTHLKQGYLDIVLENNPNELGLLVRILRHLVLKEANIFSPRLVKIVHQKLQKFDYQTIHDYEQQSYRENYISQNLVDYLITRLSQQHDSDQAVELDKFNKTIPLF